MCRSLCGYRTQAINRHFNSLSDSHVSIALSLVSERLAEVSRENLAQHFGVLQRPATWLVELPRPIKSIQVPWNVMIKIYSYSGQGIEFNCARIPSAVTSVLFLHRESPHSGGAQRSLSRTGCLWDSVYWGAFGADTQSAVSQRPHHLLLIRTASCWATDAPTAFLEDTECLTVIKNKLIDVYSVL